MAITANIEQNFYDELQQLLQFSDVDCSPAEMHGIFCGMLCTGQVDNENQWLPLLLQGLDIEADQLSKPIFTIMVQIFQTSQEQLHDITFDFHLLLPDDDEPLDKRAIALGQWCYGFLAGMGMTGVALPQDVSEDVQDILHRYYDISKMNYENIVFEEENEVDFMEVMEYVRMAVLMLYTELVLASDKHVAASGSGTIH